MCILRLASRAMDFQENKNVESVWIVCKYIVYKYGNILPAHTRYKIETTQKIHISRSFYIVRFSDMYTLNIQRTQACDSRIYITKM